MALGSEQADAGGVTRGDHAAVGRAAITAEVGQKARQQRGVVGQVRPFALPEARPADADQPGSVCADAGVLGLAMACE